MGLPFGGQQDAGNHPETPTMDNDTQELAYEDADGIHYASPDAPITIGLALATYLAEGHDCSRAAYCTAFVAWGRKWATS